MTHVLAQLKIVKPQESDELVSLARELGLELQARRYEKPLAENAFTELSADEVMIWAHHCPTHYIPGGDNTTSRSRSLEQYGFDSVPIEVMRHWKAIKDAYAFDRFEIWTTERTLDSDPLLIGCIGSKLYLLARWGMESPGNFSVKDIAQKMYDEQYELFLNWIGIGGKDYPFQSFKSVVRSRMKYLKSYMVLYPYFGAAARFLGLT